RCKTGLVIIYPRPGGEYAACKTLNEIQAATHNVTRESTAEGGKIQASIVNSGNANACTGKQGEKDAFTMRKDVSEQFSVKEEYVAVASMGIIGLDMPMDKISSHIPKLDRKITRLNSSHLSISYAVFCLKKKKSHNKAQII